MVYWDPMGKNGRSRSRWPAKGDPGCFLKMNHDELLKYALENGMIDVPYIQEQIKKNKRNEILERYGNAIWQGRNGKWYVKLPDARRGKVLKKRTTQKDIEDVVVEFYSNYREFVGFRDVYREWIEEKKRFCEIEKSSMIRYDNDFKRFFPASDPFCKIEIRNIGEGELEKFIKRQIKEKKLTAKSYAGLRLILSGVFKYARREGYTDFKISVFFDELSLSGRIFSKKVKSAKEERFSVSEAERLLSYLQEHDTPVNMGLALQFFTGMRVGELAALKAGDNDRPCIIRVSRTEFTYYEETLGKRVAEVKDFPKTEKGIKVRKTYGSLLLSRGVAETIVQNQMGHKNISTTQNYYFYDITEDADKISQINRHVKYGRIPVPLQLPL